MISKKKIVSLLMVACILAGAPQMPAMATELAGDMETNVLENERTNVPESENEVVEIIYGQDGAENSTSAAENSLAEYDENDLAVINRIITENGLGEQGYQENEPWDWDFIGWSGTEPDKVEGLELDDMGLSGKLDVSGLSSMTYLSCGNNNLSSLDVSNLSNLTYLLCYSNNLSSLDVSNLSNLTHLSCGSNNLSRLNVSGLNSLESLLCYSNNLSSLDVNDLNNLEDLFCYSNNLSSLDVSGLSNLWYLDCGSNNLSSLDVSGLNSLRYLSCESNNLSSLDVSNLNNLEDLFCYSNNLSSLDVSNLSNLTFLTCGSNNLSSLDVSGLSSLTSLDCGSNNLSSLDVSGLSSLRYLACGSNNLISLDVSDLNNLENLACYSNNLISLDVSGLSSLRYLSCGSNNLINLDASGLTNLTELYCGYNNLISLDVSNLSNLTSLSCGSNNLISLDVSGLSSLTSLSCGSNNLSSLDVSGLSNLWSLDCGSNNLSSLDVSGLNSLRYLSCEGNNLSSLDVSGLTNLAELYCDYNNLSSLDVSGLSSLTSLSCGSNHLSSLDVSGLSRLMSLSCESNNLSSLDVSGLGSLTSLSCESNNLSSLDVSGLGSLTSLSCGSNDLSSLDVSGLTNMAELHCFSNKLKKLTMPNGKNLSINDSSTAEGVADGIAILSGRYNLLETIRLEADAYEGYQFQNWDIEGIILSESDLANPIIEFEMPENDVTIAPIFTAKGTESSTTYYVTYQLNGGTQNSNNPSTYTGELSLALYNPTRTGYTFGGWYADSNFATARFAKIGKGTTGDLTLYAKWNPISYQIKYQLNNGKNNSSNPNTYTIESTVTLNVPIRTGYTFDGWYKESNFKDKISSIARNSTGNITLHAKWIANKYTVTFDKNKGSNLSKSSITVTYANTYGALPTVTRKGYTFKGWYTQKSGGTKITSKTNVSITKTQTLYAQWTAVTKPSKATISSTKNNKAKQMDIKLGKVNGADGYEISYSTNGKFKSASKITTTSLSRTISKLTKGKTYHVKVRAYKLDSAQNKVYGSYSTVSKITIRK